MLISQWARALFVAAVVLVVPQTACAGPSTAVSRGGDNLVPAGSAADVFDDEVLANLAVAACDGDTGQISRLVQEGANPNGTGAEDYSVLGWAVTCDNPEGVRALLEAGADPNKVMGARYSPTYLAATRSRATLAELLEHGGDPNTLNDGTSMLQQAFIGARSTNDWQAYDYLLRNGANIDFVSQTGSTIAIDAVIAARFDKLEELLNLGYGHDLQGLADEIQTMDGPLDATQAAHRRNVLRILEHKGVRVSIEH